MWQLPSVLISPHRPASTGTQDGGIMELFIASLKKFLGGEQPNDAVNIELFY